MDFIATFYRFTLFICVLVNNVAEIENCKDLNNDQTEICQRNTQGPVVSTTCGQVEGVAGEYAYSFKGIPYASPPIKNLRWRPPEVLKPETGNCWDGVYNATDYGNICFQRDPLDTTKTIGNEDCLYLNVFTPTLESIAKKPVMVWIHGGFLNFASGSWPLYSPTEKLAKDTDVVYVGFNYRLNAFGFMALQILADASLTKTSGNYGFMDMLAVLNWVQTNIANFGGDPNQVTVFGQSSGGTAIFALLASELANGLFHKAWMASASVILNKTATDAFKDNRVFLENSNCFTLDCLQAMTSQEVISSVPWDKYPAWAMADQSDLPTKGVFDGALAVVDGVVLKQAPLDAWMSGNLIDVPVLVGTCANEIDDEPTDMTLPKWTWADYESNVKQKLEPFGSDILQTAMALYPSGVISPEYQFTSMASDLRENCPNDVMAICMASTFKSAVYRYVMTESPSVPVNPVGIPYPASYAFHMWDIFAFFGFVPDYIENPTTEDYEFQRNMQNEVLNFVRNGKPYTSSWKQYPVSTASLSHVTTPLSAYHPVQCQFWLKNGFFSYAWIN